MEIQISKRNDMISLKENILVKDVKDDIDVTCFQTVLNEKHEFYSENVTGTLQDIILKSKQIIANLTHFLLKGDFTIHLENNQFIKKIIITKKGAYNENYIKISG